MNLGLHINLIFALLIILLEPNNITTDDDCKEVGPGDLLQPGRGWDALTSKIKSFVFLLGPLKCKLRFLKGENIILTDVDETLVRNDLLGFYPNTFYPVTALNMSLNPHSWNPIDGFFTKGFQNLFKRKIEQRLVTNRIVVRRVVFRMEMKKSSPFHPNFEKRIAMVAKSIDAKNYKLAKLQLDLIVRDYGTHYVTRTDTGAIYIQQDLLSHDLMVAKSDTEADDISLAGKSLFQQKCNFSESGMVVPEAVMSEYPTLLQSSSKKFIGGVETDVCSSYDAWNDAIYRNMEVVDRKGRFLDEIMIEERKRFPKLANESVYDDLASMWHQAIASYYTLNSRNGCLNLDSLNYDAVVNFDDGSCIASSEPWALGEYKYYGPTLISPPYEPEPQLLSANPTIGYNNINATLRLIDCFHLISAIIFSYAVFFG